MSTQSIDETRPGRSRRGYVALVVALVADGLQWVLLPLVLGGGASPVNNAIDVGVAIAMIVLVGWHWAFLPTFIAELIPVFDLVPTWTIAVWLATRGRRPTPPQLPGGSV